MTTKTKKKAIYNTSGTKFSHCVRVPKDPKMDATYSFKFPVLTHKGVETRWGTKVRPIKSLTTYLQGCSLKRYQDYMVQYDNLSKHYEYWFKDPRMALLFSLRCSYMKQKTAGKGYPFKIECPNCQHQFRNPTWTV